MFSTKSFIACAFLFHEIFAITGPLSCILQNVNIDFGKAFSLIDSIIKQLSKLRNCPKDMLSLVEHDYENISWKEKNSWAEKVKAWGIVPRGTTSNG